MKSLVVLLLGCLLSISVAQAQVAIPGTNLTVTPVNGGTGTLTSILIPGGSGLSVTVGTGSAAIPLQNIANNPNAVNITTYDDWYNEVPLGFDFPLYGRVFNNSWAMTNGLVTFQDPSQSGLGGACCSGVDLRTTTDRRYNYTIYGLHTDLYSWNGQNQFYLRGTNEMTYGWYNVSQCCSSQGGNSFEIKINSAGLVDTRVAGAMVQWNAVTSGMAGDLSKGEYYQYYHGTGLNITPGSSSVFSWQALGGTSVVDQCVINPLSSPSCPGYQAAYTTQQCTISSLWDPSCPGYQTAYFTQQCSINPLYDRNCPGYATAYHDQQCSLNALYATDCPGYASAYLQQQCTANPLYSTTCDGYAVAYKAQQCTANPLYATDCPNYAEAYFNQQCKLDSLYSNKCEGYATAYAIKYLIVGIDSTVVNNSLSQTAAAASPTPTQTVVATNVASTTISTDGTVSTGVSATGDTNVDKAIASKASTTNAAPAAVQLAPPPPPPQQMAQNEPKGGNNKQEDKKDDAPKGTGGSNSPQNTNTTQASSDKPAAPTARQAIQERREAAAKAEAVEKGKNLAGEMGKASDLEAQKAVQNVVIQAMGFTPGFDAYGKQIIVQQQFYKPYQVYGNQKTIDNRANLRMFGGTDKLHNEMVDAQYKEK